MSKQKAAQTKPRGSTAKNGGLELVDDFWEQGQRVSQLVQEFCRAAQKRRKIPQARELNPAARAKVEFYERWLRGLFSGETVPRISFSLTPDGVLVTDVECLIALRRIKRQPGALKISKEMGDRWLLAPECDALREQVDKMELGFWFGYNRASICTDVETGDPRFSLYVLPNSGRSMGWLMLTIFCEWQSGALVQTGRSHLMMS